MLLVGLTGGIGSGKSTVAADLAGHGAAIVDADLVAREVVEPDGPAYRPLVDRFGSGIVGADGRIDRPALAAVAFADADALADLNRITHPAIGKVMAERLEQAAQSATVVVLDIPLLNDEGKKRYGFDVVIVVDTPEEVAVRRLIEHRSFSRTDAEARVASQIGREERRALADVVVDNSGDREALSARLGELWAWLEERLAAKGGDGPAGG